jgi:RHS repeat-associated protein
MLAYRRRVVVSSVVSWEVYYVLHGGQDTAARLVDAGGVVREQYEDDPYGMVKVYSGAGSYLGGTSPLGLPFLWKAVRLDAETGLLYMRNRYYSTGLGRFLTRDPIGVWGDPLNCGNETSYVGNRGLVFGDPMGHQGEFQNGSAEFTSFMEAGTFLGMRLARDLGSVAGDAFGKAWKSTRWSLDNVLDLPTTTIAELPRSWDGFCERRSSEYEFGLLPSVPRWYSRSPIDDLIKDLGFRLPIATECFRDFEHKKVSLELIVEYDLSKGNWTFGVGGTITF